MGNNSQTKLTRTRPFELMKIACEGGINVFDIAETYANGDAERFIHRRREAEHVGLSRKHVLEGAAASLGRIGLEYVDIVSVTGNRSCVQSSDRLGKGLLRGYLRLDCRPHCRGLRSG
mmetsp:Transcript_42095/g.164743  ORF Transcript_42095/g.164743 Transcript_42095/m.164743 type:complete len:118 (-) Transcript_42095:341-694(-)